MPTALTRRIVLICALALGPAAMPLAAPAQAAQAPAAASSSQVFVRSNLGSTIEQLSKPGIAPAERSQKFGALMDQFADLPRIAEFVLGQYAAQLRQDRALYQEWQRAFRDYAVTVYQGQLDQYTAERFEVGRAQESERNGKRYSIVSTKLYRPNGDVLDVDWRLIQTGAGWRVIDVALKNGESTVWLSLTQQSEFLAFLRANNGDIRALVRDVQARTKTIRDLMADRR